MITSNIKPLVFISFEDAKAVIKALNSKRIMSIDKNGNFVDEHLSKPVTIALDIMRRSIANATKD